MKKRNGIALILALLSAFALTSAALVLGSYCALSGIESEVSLRRCVLRISAEAAALRGLAELQWSAGPDAVYTYVGDDKLLHSVSAKKNYTIAGEAWMDSVKWTWEIADLSMLHDRAAGSMAHLLSSAWARSSDARSKLPRGIPDALSEEQISALTSDAADFFGSSELELQGTTWQTRGLLTDPVRGGWRRDLSQPAELAQVLEPALVDKLLSSQWKLPPAKGYPMVQLESENCRLSTLPTLTDFRLSMGFFNSRHDGRHRLRFHASGVFWNSLTVPVLAGTKGRLFLVEIVGGPEVTVENLSSGADFIVDLDECPLLDIGAVRQEKRDQGIWFFADVVDKNLYGMGARGLLPGEVFAFLQPPKDIQPQGLARILTDTTWRLDRRGPAANRKRADANTFFLDDRIEITARFRHPMTIRLREYKEEPERDELIADYPGDVVMEIKNIKIPEFKIRLKGEDYSREDSSGYVIDDRLACLRLRWRPRPLDEFRKAVSGLIRTHWDLDIPEDAAEWSIEKPVLSALDVVDHDASPLSGPLWDLSVNQHNANDMGAFSTWKLREVPTWPILSVGSLRHLESPKVSRWASLLDKSFFSAPLESPEVGVVSHQPFIIAPQTHFNYVAVTDGNSPQQLCVLTAPPSQSTESAENWRIAGPWNVNSRDSKAWESFLRSSLRKWETVNGGPFDPTSLNGFLFFTRPSGGRQPNWGAVSAIDLPDSAFFSLLPIESDALQSAQSVRSIAEDRLRLWAQKIVQLQPECGWPYSSLEAFATSPLLERSLLEAGINTLHETLEKGMPLRIEAANLIEAWAPILCVRGDTFKITGRAEGWGGAMVCELVVQREPVEHQIKGLGRKFVIQSIRFRRP